MRLLPPSTSSPVPLELKSDQSGFSFIELILVVALVLLLGAASSPFLSTAIIRAQLDRSTAEVVGGLRRAQARAIADTDATTWGVCFTSGVIRVFSGSCASPTSSEEYTVPNVVNISGFSTITFSTFRGEPSSPLSITLSTSIQNNTVSINAAGGIDAPN